MRKKTISTSITTLFILIGMPACNNDRASTAKGDQPAVDPADVKAAVAANNAFAVDLYRELSAKRGNLFVSPYSISSALAMTYAGARTLTAEEMAKTFHFTLPNDRLHAVMGKLQGDFNARDKKRP